MAKRVMPALLNSTSRRPNRSVAWAIRRQSASNATSPCTTMASAPASRTARAVISASSAERA